MAAATPDRTGEDGRSLKVVKLLLRLVKIATKATSFGGRGQMSATLDAGISHQVFERFLGEQRPMLVSYLRGRGLSLDDAQDIAQESLYKLTRYRDLPAQALRPLLYRIALNALHDSRRRQSGMHQTSLSDMDLQAHDIQDEMPRPEQWAENREELARVRAAINLLPERCREIYLLNRVEGMSYSQISRHCGISVKAVEKHMGKALTSLRKLLSIQTRPTGVPGQIP
ncbi:RNA polymerase sigma factor [Pseudoxanthomonas beigongshangi]|jgi:RNA polymerase sigma-70 factor (ECF subfamily)